MPVVRLADSLECLLLAYPILCGTLKENARGTFNVELDNVARWPNRPKYTILVSNFRYLSIQSAPPG